MKATKVGVFCPVVCLVTLFLSIAVEAQSRFDHFLWEQAYPNVVGTKLQLSDGCITCHTMHNDPQTGSVYNIYADDIIAELDAGATTLESFANVEHLDSDGDGFSNIGEIVGITYPGDPTDYPPSTIEILLAKYDYVGNSLKVQATSVYGPDAALELFGLGPMKWREKKGLWVRTVPDVLLPPEGVTVCGQYDACVTLD